MEKVSLCFSSGATMKRSVDLFLVVLLSGSYSVISHPLTHTVHDHGVCRERTTQEASEDIRAPTESTVEREPSTSQRAINIRLSPMAWKVVV